MRSLVAVSVPFAHHVHLAQAELQRDGARGEYHETGDAEERATEP